MAEDVTMVEVDDRSDWADLTAAENLLAGRLAAVRREKARMKLARIESGDEERAVTDHALVRYLERHKGLDVDAVRAELRTLATEALPAKDGEHHWHPSGVLLILGEDGQVVTVLSPGQAGKWAGRKLANGERVAARPTPEGEGK